MMVTFDVKKGRRDVCGGSVFAHYQKVKGHRRARRRARRLVAGGDFENSRYDRYEVTRWHVS